MTMVRLQQAMIHPARARAWHWDRGEPVESRVERDPLRGRGHGPCGDDSSLWPSHVCCVSVVAAHEERNRLESSSPWVSSQSSGGGSSPACTQVHPPRPRVCGAAAELWELSKLSIGKGSSELEGT
ncbi:hypothetical protein FH972_024160 [Carpinus fangiana]|uniref:Uncharacterized protein n=1 Tax=Carpinus fangiana TaxID=176857 RepID=A0A5N6KXQ5_9ROSI|nr:hypothetical protein FH972_024160 [Carpinus fangiana]